MLRACCAIAAVPHLAQGTLAVVAPGNYSHTANTWCTTRHLATSLNTRHAGVCTVCFSKDTHMYYNSQVWQLWLCTMAAQH
jgi:hypothetical protein